MATLVPSRAIIDGPDFQPKLEPSEERLLEALCRALPSDEWTIYVQPFLNGLHPDFVLFNPHYGITIIEVKDLKYGSYEVSKHGVRPRNAPRAPWQKTAFDQVVEYKKALINYEAPFLGEQIALAGQRLFSIVKCATYFDGYTSTCSDKYWQFRSDEQRVYISIIGSDDLSPGNEGKLRTKINATTLSHFHEVLQMPEMASSLHAALGYPDLGELTEERVTTLSPEQQKWATSRPEFKHIKGAAGSGKTMILANRAADALASNKAVLATCFNITMRNYLRDVVNVARRALGIPRVRDGALQVNHFHNELMQVAKALGINTQIPDSAQGDDEAEEAHWRRVAANVHAALLALSPAERTQKGIALYDSIFVDEGQDFEPEWIELLKLLFRPDVKPEIVVMSDPAQNIYNKETSRAKSLAGFKGKPPVLKQSYRLRGRIASASKFWLEVMSDGDQETLPEFQPTLLGEIRWVNGYSESKAAEFVLKAVKQRQINRTQWADIAVITTNRWVARDIADALLENGIPTQPTVASNEDCDDIEKACAKNYENITDAYQLERKVNTCIKRQTRDIERQRKLQFGRKTGRLKLTTIHSFKGWEWPHVILVLSGSDQAHDTRNELVYTGLTRPLQSLHVINCMPEIDHFRDVLDSEGLLVE